LKLVASGSLPNDGKAWMDHDTLESGGRRNRLAGQILELAALI
jgi:hypothetical protein